MQNQESVFWEQGGISFLEISGPDARDFLHRLTTVNFKFLKVQQYSPGAFLQHTGKLILFFKVLRTEESKYLLLLPEGFDSQKAYEEFEKMHFAEKLDIKILKDTYAAYRVIATQPQAINPSSSTWVCDENEYTKISNSKWKQDQTVIVPLAQKEETEKRLQVNFQKVSKIEQEYFRIEAGVAAAPSEITPGVNPLELGLESAVHENKGCYPGQEVIERIRSMGQAPRKLCALQGTGEPPKVETKLKKDDQEAGTVTSVAINPKNSEQWSALAFVKKQYLKEPLNFDWLNGKVTTGHPVQL